jgi:hypothetical protein
VAFFYAVSKPMNHEASARKTIQEAKRATDPSAQMEGPALSGPPMGWRDRLCPVRRWAGGTGSVRSTDGLEGPALSGPPMDWRDRLCPVRRWTNQSSSLQFINPRSNGYQATFSRGAQRGWVIRRRDSSSSFERARCQTESCVIQPWKASLTLNSRPRKTVDPLIPPRAAPPIWG